MSIPDSASRWDVPRTLLFPYQASLGELFVRTVDDAQDADADAGEAWSPRTWKRRGDARGTVTIEGGAAVCLRVPPRGVRALLRYLRYDTPALDALHLSFTECNDRDLAAFGSGFDGLLALYLKATRVTPDGLAALAPQRLLRALHLGKLRPGRTGLAHVAALPALAELDLSGTRVTDDDLAGCSAAPALRDLRLYETRVHGPGLRALRGCARLAVLDLRHTRLRVDALADVAALASLRTLLLPRGVCDAAVAYLAPLSQLEYLSFTGCLRDAADGRPRWSGIGDAALAHLPALRALRVLDLAFAPVTDAGLAAVGQIATLRSLSLWNSAVRGPGLAHLAALPRLESLVLENLPLVDAHLAPLAGLATLRSLDLMGTSLTDAALPLLASMPALRRAMLPRTISRSAAEALRRARPELVLGLAG